MLVAEMGTCGGVPEQPAKQQGSENPLFHLAFMIRLLPCRSVKHGSFFAQSNLSLQKYLLVILHWAYDDQVSDMCERVNVSSRTGVQCFQYVRDICSWRLLQNPIRLGGRVGVHDRLCQIDESCFSHKPKVYYTLILSQSQYRNLLNFVSIQHHRGHPPREPIWVFGIVDTSYTPSLG